MSRIITIGREASCDIAVSERHNNVSRRHATIRQEDDRLVLEDTSTSGTYVNGRMIHHDRIVINYGDRISLGSDYPLEWRRIMEFFTSLATSLGAHDRRETVKRSGRPTERHGHVPSGRGYHEPELQRHNAPERESIDKRELGKWNWGAFALYPLWGFANGMWWLVILAIVISFLSSVSTLFIAPFLGLIVSICMGVQGSKLAWEKKQWSDFGHFKQVQAQWKPWGIAVFVLNILVWIIIITSL